jgi:type I restriction-modification system DNA methylase subunit
MANQKSALAFASDKNQVGTPRHIVQFVSDLLGASGKRVLDPTAGSGNLLEFAGEKIGIELDEKAYHMICDRYPEGIFVLGDIFDNEEWMKSMNPDLIFMNPPFNVGKAKGLDFIKFAADAVGHGMLAAIVPVGALHDSRKAMIAIREGILARHRLVAVMDLNNELFYPAAAVGASLIILELGKPHDGKTWFADFKNDGFEKSRAAKGRIDKNGTWASTEARWIEYYHSRPTYDIKEDMPSDYIPCSYTELSAGNWGASQYIKMDPRMLRPTLDDFKKAVRDYMDFRIDQVGLPQFLKEHPDLAKDHPEAFPSKEERIKKLQDKIQQLQEEIDSLLAMNDI